MAPVQTSYNERIEKGFEGGFANETNYDVDTKICETSAGINFGRAVSKGSADNGAVLGGALADFVGITVRDTTLLAANADKYPQYALMGVLTEGDIWVKPSVQVADGDPVHFNATTGVFTNTGGSGPIKGARYQTSAAANALAVVRLGGGLPPN